MRSDMFPACSFGKWETVMIVEEMEGEGVPRANVTPSNSPTPSEGPAEKKGKFEVRVKGCFCLVKLRIFSTLHFRDAVSWHYVCVHLFVAQIYLCFFKAPSKNQFLFSLVTVLFITLNYASTSNQNNSYIVILNLSSEI